MVGVGKTVVGGKVAPTKEQTRLLKNGDDNLVFVFVCFSPVTRVTYGYLIMLWWTIHHELPGVNKAISASVGQNYVNLQ